MSSRIVYKAVSDRSKRRKETFSLDQWCRSTLNLGKIIYNFSQYMLLCSLEGKEESDINWRLFYRHLLLLDDRAKSAKFLWSSTNVRLFFSINQNFLNIELMQPNYSGEYISHFRRIGTLVSQSMLDIHKQSV